MDRISDSGSDDWGSTPHGDTQTINRKTSLKSLAIYCFVPVFQLRMTTAPNGVAKDARANWRRRSMVLIRGRGMSVQGDEGVEVLSIGRIWGLRRGLNIIKN